MSLTTVAATITSREDTRHLSPSRPERFQRSDFIAAAFVYFITLGVYIVTMSPSVTLEDSGELITGAVTFGVPHPPGYPLWTMSGFLISHLFPFGNLAWRINLLSALFGATANAILTLLVCHSGRWLLQRWTEESAQPVVRRFSFYAGMLAGLTIGFSDVMWSQSVIAEVYTLNAFFVNLVLLLFYFWMLEPQKTHRLIITVFVFALGLTNHHTLIQMIPAILVAAFVLRVGKFWSVFIAVNLFSLSILVYLSWLSGNEPLHPADGELQKISTAMAWLIFGLTAVISFFYLKQFQWRFFLGGVLTVLAFFAYGHYLMGPGEFETLRFTQFNVHYFWLWGSLVHPGWLQITTRQGLGLMALGALAVGLLFSSKLDRRLVIGLFAAGWVGLTPYAYERLASSTNPPMNWGFASERSGFYYAVSREQYPMSLPNLIKTTIGKAIRVVPLNENPDAMIGRPNYFKRLCQTFYYYGDNLQDNITAPLIFLALSILVYCRRCDAPQVSWFIFLGMAFFFLGFMLHVIEPPSGFDFESNLQYKVFHLQSHCIFVIFMGYGALAAMTYLRELLPELEASTSILVIGVPGLFLSLLPLWSNFNDGNQAGHWFGYDFGADIMRPLDKNAVYYGGSDPGRFIPTYTAFVESQQSDRWKREPGFDRRDVTVITQNALCDEYYCSYIRHQYDPRFRPQKYTLFEKWLGRDHTYPTQPITCVSPEELSACWQEYDAWPDVARRMKYGGPRLRPNSNDVFDLNGIVARKIFEKNKQNHTFYVEQSIPIDWMYPYLLPSGLIFKLNSEPMAALPPGVIEQDRKFWDAYSVRLLQDPQFRVDDDATITFGKLAMWHADLYRWRHLDKEQEYWLKMALALCPQLQSAVDNLSRLLQQQKRFDEALALVKQAQADDPRNEAYAGILDRLTEAKHYVQREQELNVSLAKSPNDPQLHLQLARVLQGEGKFDELDNHMRIAAGLTNWSHEEMAALIQYYVEAAHNPDAAIAFLEVRAKIDPKASELVYSLAALHALLEHKDEALKYLTQSASVGGTNALVSASIDPRFESMRDDPRFQALVGTVKLPVTNQHLTNPPPVLPKPSPK